MSLLQKLSFKEYKKAQDFTREQSEVLAKLADLKIVLSDTNPERKPGEQLIKELDRNGFTLNQYHDLLVKASNVKTVITYYKPNSKVAILIANENYKHLTKLATPYTDCKCLANHLKNLGFIVFIVRDVTRKVLLDIIDRMIRLIPEDSYCFIFYAGHGCEILSVKCILAIDCPPIDIGRNDFLSENVILNAFASCNLELCIFIMDMCRYNINLSLNSRIMDTLPNIQPHSTHRNLLISYSTQSSQPAYEMIQLECSNTINSNLTYELKTGDTSKLVPGTSQYVNALITRIEDNLDVSLMLDKVHEDVESMVKQQKPMKMQCGAAKHSLYDQVQGDSITLLTCLRALCDVYPDNCVVY